MARYWKAAVSGNWDASTTTNWSATSGGAGGQSVPNSTQDVYIDQNGSYTVSITATASCLTFNVTGSGVTIAFGASQLTTFGSVFYVASGTGWSGTGFLSFSSTTDNCLVTTNGVTLTNQSFVINGAGGVTLGSALTMSNNLSNINVILGTLNLAGFSCNSGIFTLSTTIANTRGLDWGAGGSITLNNTTAGTTVLSGTTHGGFTLSGTGTFYSNANTTKTYQWGTNGGSSATAVNLTITGGGSSAQTIFNSGIGSWFKNLDISGVSCAYTSSTLVNITQSITLSASSAYTTATFTIVISNAGVVINQNGSASPFGCTINIPGGTWVANASISNFGTLTLTAGTLDVSSYDLTMQQFTSTNTNTRSIAFGSRNMYVQGGAASTGITMTDQTNFTYTGTGGFSVDSSSGSRSIKLGETGGSIANAVNLTFSGANGIASSTTSAAPSWINNFNLAGYAVASTTAYFYNIVGNLTAPTSGSTTTIRNATFTFVNTTGTQTITSNGTTIGAILITGGSTVSLLDALIMTNSTITATITLSFGTLKMNGFTCTLITFVSNSGSTRTLDWGSGGTSSITTTSSISSFTVLSCSNLSGFTTTGTGTFIVPINGSRTITCGNGGAPVSPFSVTINSGTTAPTITTGSYFNKLDFAGSNFVAGITSLNLYSLTLGSGTYTSITPTFYGTGTITSNGKNISSPTINHTGTTTIADALNCTNTFTLTSGGLVVTGVTLTTVTFSSGASGTRSITGGGTGIISVSSNWSVSGGTGFTGSDYTINMTKVSAKAFDGGGGSYGILVQAGSGLLTISGSNTLADIQATATPSTITFTAGTTQTLGAFTLAGTAGSLVTINSTSTGSQFTMSRASGTINASYLSIQDSNVTGGASWYNNNGTNTVLTNNTGWNSAPAGPINGQFFSFF